MRVMILGSKGMAGHMISKYLKSKKYEVTTVARKGADKILNIKNSSSVDKFLNKLEEDYDFVINCIGMLVKPCIDDPVSAILVNSLLPKQLEKHFKSTKTRVIHLSTDCIFDGSIGNYSEDSIPTETNAYGRSKMLGEINNDKDITFRMSIIGPEIKNGTGLLHWVTTSQESDLNGWSNALWNGITTLQLAKCIEQYMLNPKISGIYHLTPTEFDENWTVINKYELICKINDVYGLEKNIIESQGPKTTNKVLVNNRKHEMDFNIPSYDVMLNELKEYH